jgi:ComF family protein
LTLGKPFIDTFSLRSFLSAVPFNLVFPEDCRVCESPLDNLSRIPVCDRCLRAPEPMVAEFFCSQCKAPFLNSSPLDSEGRCRLCRAGLAGFQRAFAYGEYDGTLRKLIHLFKYGGIEPLAQPLGAMLSRALPRNIEFDAIVPMPLHWFRRWRRGFNQSELLARALSGRTGLPVIPNAMTRRKSTAPQAGLSGAQRRLNVSGAFAVRRRHLIEERRVLLVDDVLTTGATAGTCAAALRRAGAREVSVLTLARVDRRRGISGRSIS